MYARILGYLIWHAPSLYAQTKFVDTIYSYNQDEKKLLKLATCFQLLFTLPFELSSLEDEAAQSRDTEVGRHRLHPKNITGPPKDRRGAKAQLVVTC